MFEDSYGGSIYEEVGEARRIYDVPKSLENEAKSLTPPPPLPSRLCKSAAEVTEEDSLEFPPPPAFGDEQVHTHYHTYSYFSIFSLSHLFTFNNPQLFVYRW